MGDHCCSPFSFLILLLIPLLILPGDLVVITGQMKSRIKGRIKIGIKIQDGEASTLKLEKSGGSLRAQEAPLLSDLGIWVFRHSMARKADVGLAKRT